MRYAPVSGLSLALFSVLASSSMLFLSPFIFQFPPTKNFLPDMIVKCCFHQKALDVGKRPKTSGRRDSEEIQSAGVYIILVCKLRPRRLPLDEHSTPRRCVFFDLRESRICSDHDCRSLRISSHTHIHAQFLKVIYFIHRLILLLIIGNIIYLLLSINVVFIMTKIEKINILL